jgi:hypothetical protein
MLYVEVNGDQPTRPDVDASIFVDRLYRISVETVNKNRNSEPLPAEHWYSIVRKIHPVSPSTPFNLPDSGNPQNLGNPSTDQPSNLDNLPLGKSVASHASMDRKDKFGVVDSDPSIATPVEG